MHFCDWPQRYGRDFFRRGRGQRRRRALGLTLLGVPYHFTHLIGQSPSTCLNNELLAPRVAEATGWAQHTVRGFFAGLKKRQGITVEIAERIRQVGPNKQGAKGSYTVYRVAE